MRHFLSLAFSLAFAASFVGAQCGNPTPLTRSCPGSTVQSEKFYVLGSCGGSGVVEISVPTAGDCTLALTEASGVNLPTTGTFAPAAGATSYAIAQGSWNLQPATTGMLGDNGGLTCTSGTPTMGVLNMTCQITTCSTVGEDLEPTCMPMGSCNVQLTPAPDDAGISGPLPDAGTDAGTDATISDGGED